MDYLNRLSKTDVESICKLIGSRDLKQNFQTNSNGFSRIKPVFRPKTISDEEAVTLTVQNVTTRFISKFLNEKIQSLMDKIIGEQANLMAKGIPSDDAHIIALANSPFYDNLDLYFRLEQPVRSSEEIGALKIAIRIAKRAHKPDSVEDAPTDRTTKLLKEELEAQKEYARNKIQQVQDLLKETQASLQATAEDATRLRDEKDELKNKLDLKEKELTRYRALEKYSISNRIDTTDAKYPFKSLCKVFWADGYVRLKRLSDIHHDEITGDYLEEFPTQRDLFSDQRSGTFQEGYVGVWDWHVIPNKKDPSRDFIETSYSSSQPTQIIIFKECDSVEKIIKKLTVGVSEKIYCDGVLFAYWNGKKYEGIYCHPKDLDIKIDRISLKQDVFRLPVFEVFASMLYQAGDCQVCTALNFGMPTKVVNVKDSMDVLKASITERSMNDLYDYFCLAAGQHHVQIFHEPEREKFGADCNIALSNYERSTRRNREYTPRFSIANAPTQMQKDLLRLFSGGYNTLYDSATSWIEPTEQALFDSIDELEENGISVEDEEFLELFNAWMISVCDDATALGHTIPDEVRLEVRRSYDFYGLAKEWNFTKTVHGIMGWTDDSNDLNVLRRVLKNNFLDSAQPDNGRLYVDLQRVKPRFDANARNVNIGYDFITDMLVLEIKLDEQKMDIHRTDNPWLTRAAQSLAEAFRLAASKELDIEFTELVTGYRIRTNNAGAFVDVYLYDSLSSGAGYAVSVADNIETLLNRIRELLASCDCGNACHKCLKHYRNQYVHGLLDRFAALELLDWGVNGELADSLTVEGQKALLLPLESILRVSGCTLLVTNNEIVAKHRGREVKLVVYPAMWKEPREDGTIYVSDAYIKYAKPYAVQKILNV